MSIPNKVIYNKRTWLNSESSPSTGNIVAFDYTEGEEHNRFLSISDCYNSARLHATKHETTTDFINKLTIIRDEVDVFINYLKDTYED